MSDLRTATDQLASDLEDPFASVAVVRQSLEAWFRAMSAQADNLHDWLYNSDARPNRAHGQDATDRYQTSSALAGAIARIGAILPAAIDCTTVPALPSSPDDIAGVYPIDLREGDRVRFPTDSGVTPWLRILSVSTRGEVGDAAHLVLEGDLTYVALGHELVECDMRERVG